MLRDAPIPHIRKGLGKERLARKVNRARMGLGRRGVSVRISILEVLFLCFAVCTTDLLLSTHTPILLSYMMDHHCRSITTRPFNLPSFISWKTCKPGSARSLKLYRRMTVPQNADCLCTHVFPGQ